MKRLAPIVVLAVALAVPGAAQAAKIKHRGEITGVAGTQVRFVVKKDHGKLRNISNMVFKDVPVTCEDGSTGTVTGFLPKFPVSGKDFTRKGKIEGIGIKSGFLRVAGEFRAGGRRASGSVRFSFKSTAGLGCGTDDAPWETQKR